MAITSITLEEFITAPKGSGIKDIHERIWEFKDEPKEKDAKPKRLMQCPGYPTEIIRYSTILKNGPQLIDEEYGIILELNGPSVVLVK